MCPERCSGTESREKSGSGSPSLRGLATRCLTPAILPAAAVSAILQGYGDGQGPVTDTSAELYRLCGCLELLLQVGPSPPPPHPSPQTQTTGRTFLENKGGATVPFLTVHYAISLSLLTPDLTLGGCHCSLRSEVRQSGAGRDLGLGAGHTPGGSHHCLKLQRHGCPRTGPSCCYSEPQL